MNNFPVKFRIPVQKGACRFPKRTFLSVKPPNLRRVRGMRHQGHVPLVVTLVAPLIVRIVVLSVARTSVHTYFR
jgi:hypothetical protein